MKGKRPRVEFACPHRCPSQAAAWPSRIATATRFLVSQVMRALPVLGRAVQKPIVEVQPLRRRGDPGTRLLPFPAQLGVPGRCVARHVTIGEYDDLAHLGR